MKALSLLAMILTLVFQSSLARPPMEDLDHNFDNSVFVSGLYDETDVARFKAEIEARQAQNPDTFFEVQHSNSKLTGSLKTVVAKDDVLYPNKNFYIFLGLGPNAKDEEIRRQDWGAIYAIMNYLATQKFRVLINVNATAEHLKLAAQDSNTSVILWSSHGNQDGFYDYNNQKVPYDIFKTKSSSFYQFILSACYGRIALNKHYEHKDLQTWAWSGLTTTLELKAFLVSDKWNAFQGKKK
jgi:hypothetical protein